MRSLATALPPPASTALPARIGFDRSLLEVADPVDAAAAILGAWILRAPGPGDGEARVARIVDVEAYGGADDLASHARSGPTRRNAAMFGPAGTLYVYRSHGIHDCCNVVTGAAGSAAAVLLRAVAPLAGIDGMRRALAERGRRSDRPVDRLAVGPGLVAAALSISLDDGGADCCDPGAALRLVPPAGPRLAAGERVVAGPRIGIGGAGEPAVSRPWRLRIVGAA